MRTQDVRLIHRDPAVRAGWRGALRQLDVAVTEPDASEDGLFDSGVIVLGDPGGGTPAALRMLESSAGAARTAKVVLVAADSSEELAIGALRLGVADYLKEPVSREKLVSTVRRLLEGACSRRIPAISQERVDRYLVGDGNQMKRVRQELQKAAVADSTVLVTGESGTGKELAARTLHVMSGRSGKLVTVNCAAIPESLLESELFGYERGAFTGAYRSEPGKLAQAESGTLFLDEIGEMSLMAQVKLLRVIETKEVQRLGARRNSNINVRIVAATNRKLEDLVAQGQFREDLYYRLNVVQIYMAPLRERIEDLPMLISHYVGVLNVQFHQNITGMDQALQERLTQYAWPGNVRELRNLLEATYVNQPYETIRFEDLPEHFRRKATELHEAPGAMSERHLLLNTLNATHWNKSRAAQKLHWSRVTLYRKLAKHGIADRPESAEVSGV